MIFWIAYFLISEINIQEREKANEIITFISTANFHKVLFLHVKLPHEFTRD